MNHLGREASAPVPRAAPHHRSAAEAGVAADARLALARGARQLSPCERSIDCPFARKQKPQPGRSCRDTSAKERLRNSVVARPTLL
jgi:hypothetical protein